jgi:hypothetical protein
MTISNQAKFPLDEIYPSIKSPAWLNSGNNLYAEPLYTGLDAPEAAPVIAYGIDQDGSVGFLLKDTLQSSEWGDMRFAAQRNLDARLAAFEWRAGLNDKQLDFEGDYYVSEGLLSRRIMNEAHDTLCATRLAAATPRRGELIALSLDGTSQSEIESFVDTVLKRYFLAKHTGSPEAISPIIWMVESGEIKGFMKLSSEYMTYWGKAIRNALTDNNDTTKTKHVGEEKREHENDDLNPQTKEKLPNQRCFSRGQIVAATLLGTITAGLLMLGWNFRMLNEHRKSKALLWATIPITTIFLYIAASLPRTSIDKLWPVISAAAVYGLAYLIQRDELNTISNNLLKRHRLWVVAMFTILGLLGSLLALTVLILLKVVEV